MELSRDLSFIHTCSLGHNPRSTYWDLSFTYTGWTCITWGFQEWDTFELTILRFFVKLSKELVVSLSSWTKVNKEVTSFFLKLDESSERSYWFLSKANKEFCNTS